LIRDFLMSLTANACPPVVIKPFAFNDLCDD